MIKGRNRIYTTKCGGMLQKIVMVVHNETVHPVTVANVYVEEVKKGYKRVFEHVKVRHDGSACTITVYDRKN